MIRLNFVVEGHSEEAFVNRILKDHLASSNVYCNARRVETSRGAGRIFRGGLIKWSKAAEDVAKWQREDSGQDVRFTTMFDLYKLPPETPGRSSAADLADPLKRVWLIERAIADSMKDSRTLPYIQLHEFEALIFAGADKLAKPYPSRAEEARALAESASKFPSPEHIDEGPTTAPSKRIIARIPEYERGKASASPIVLEQIGLAALRQHCPHFHAWISCLESLASPSPKPWPRLVTMP